MIEWRTVRLIIALGTLAWGTMGGAPARAAFFDGMFAMENGDYQGAYDEWRAEANRGDAKSLNGLGQLYEEGLGVERDPVLAYVYYDTAYFLGYDPAGEARDKVSRKLGSAERAEAKRLVSGVRQTGKLPPKSRARAAAAQAQPQPVQPAPQPKKKEPKQQAQQPAEAAAAQPAQGTQTARQVPVGRPAVDLKYACQLRRQWNDEGSGGASDLSAYEPNVPGGYRMVGGYAQGNYEPPSGCVAVLRAGRQGLLAAPRGWERLWTDKGSGARMDGSLWRALPPSNDFVCLGVVAQKGYKQPRSPTYSCVHRCAVRDVTTPAPVWTDKGTGAKSKVAVYALPLTNAMQAFPGRARPASLQDFDPFAACVWQ